MALGTSEAMRPSTVKVSLLEVYGYDPAMAVDPSSANGKDPSAKTVNCPPLSNVCRAAISTEMHVEFPASRRSKSAATNSSVMRERRIPSKGT